MIVNILATLVTFLIFGGFAFAVYFRPCKIGIPVGIACIVIGAGVFSVAKSHGGKVMATATAKCESIDSKLVYTDDWDGVYICQKVKTKIIDGEEYSKVESKEFKF